MKPQSHTSRLGSGVELSERTTSSKVRSETVDSILSAVAKKKVVTSDKGTENFDSGNTGTTSKPPSSKPPQFRCAVPWSITDSNSVNTTKNPLSLVTTFFLATALRMLSTVSLRILPSRGERDRNLCLRSTGNKNGLKEGA